MATDRLLRAGGAISFSPYFFKPTLNYMENLDTKNWYNKNINKYAKSVSASFVAKEELNLFAKSIPRGSIILDAGSGLGQDTEYLSKNGYVTIGADFSKEMIKFSLDKRKDGIFININFFEISSIFGKHLFGGLWASSSLLTHINKKDYDKFFKEAKKLLLPEGSLSIIVRKDKPKEKIEITFNNFSKKEIISLTTKNGFKIIKIKEIKIGKATWFFIISKIN